MRRQEVEAAFERYGPMVYRRARAILGNDEEARDVLQEVFIKLLSGRLRDEGPMAGWLQVVTTRVCLNLVRNRSRRVEILRERTSEAVPAVDASDNRVLVQRLLGAMDARTAEAAICVHIDGMTYDETSRHLGVSKRTVANLLARFQQAGRAWLETGPQATGDEG